MQRQAEAPGRDKYQNILCFAPAFFIVWETSFHIRQKSLRGIALRRSRIMLLTQPAAGGESCYAGFYFTETGGTRHDQ